MKDQYVDDVFAENETVTRKLKKKKRKETLISERSFLNGWAINFKTSLIELKRSQ